MAKGRKLTASLSERFLGSYGYDHGRGTVTDSEELEEDEVWSMVSGGGDDQAVINGSSEEWSPRAGVESNGTVRSTSRRHAPRVGGHVGGLSLAFDDPGKATSSSRIIHQFRGQDGGQSPSGRNMATSAPVNVPDWSKIYRVDSVESLHDSDDGDDRESGMVPPHEYLAREYRKMAANSVLEGVGRTLKGRDMSRVRDTVWNQTGFYG